MNNKKTISVLVGTMLLALVATVVHAQTTLGITTSTSGPIPTSTSTTTSATLTTPPRTTERTTKVDTRSDAAITARITALNNLNARIGQLKNVSADEKAAIAAEVQTNSTGLTSLKAKIDADTDEATLMADAKTITGSYRIYALVIPQGYIAASADRVGTISAMLSAISTKLQTRITADQSAGKNVTVMQASLTDLNAKVADANAQAKIAQSGVAGLTPDQHDTTEFSANTTALKAARVNIKTATQDLQTARADAKSIIATLKTLGIDASVSTSASTSTQ